MGEPRLPEAETLTGTRHPDCGVPAVRPGDMIAGRYEVEGIAGEGGMAVVYSARHLHLQERFAIKVLRPLYAAGRATVSRFMQEARAAAQLRSEHVCRVFDVGLLPDGAPYIVMELLEGASLGEVIARNEPLSVEEIVEYTIQACEALTEAHACGVVHRDIKPENLFLTRKSDGWRAVKLLDFGISKIVDRDALDTSIRRHRDTGNMLGTPHYMAPEQVRSSRDVDSRSDLWSLGVVLYELLGGRLPFDGTTVPEISAAIIETEPTSLAAIRPDLPEQVVEAVHWCLSKQPELRVSSACELAVELMRFGPRRSRAVVERMQSLARKQGDIVHLPASIAPAPLTTEGPLVEIPRAPIVPAVNSEPEPRTSSVSLWALAAAAAFVVAAGVVFLQLRSGAASSPTSQIEKTSEPTTTTPGTSAETALVPGRAMAPASPPEPAPAASTSEPQKPPPTRGRLVLPPAKPTAVATSAPRPSWDSGPDMGF